MKKLTLSLTTLAFLIGAHNTTAQTFTEQTTTIDGVAFSSVSFNDSDGDNDQDIVVTGETNNGQHISKVYVNDGNASFSEVPIIPIAGVAHGDITFVDVTGNGVEDLIVTGVIQASVCWSELITFVGGAMNSSTPFDGVCLSSIDFADVDGDNDQDVLITGRIGPTTASAGIAKLYENDGNGNFTEVVGTPFDGVWSSSVDFADVDGDNDQDVLITGNNNSDDRIAKLYTNDGNGNFTEVTGTPFTGVWQSSIAFADVDNDLDQDVFITGFDQNFNAIAKLYQNDGMGGFNEVMGTPFDGVHECSISFADFHADGDPDVLISGMSGNGVPITKLYQNDGNGNFAEITGTPFEGVFRSSVDIADVNGDSNLDIFITGENSSGQHVSKLYLQDACGNIDNTTSTSGNTLTANNSNATYQWLDCDNNYNVISGETNSDFTPTQNGNFAVEVNENGCIDTSACVTITTIGLHEIGTAFHVQVYPNPTSDIIQVQAEKAVSKLELYKLDGQLVTEVTGNQIDLSTVKSGVYLLRVYQDSHVTTVRVKRK